MTIKRRPIRKPGKVVTELDRFAQALADSAGTPHDGNVSLIAMRLGITQRNANAKMQVLRKNFGLEEAI